MSPHAFLFATARHIVLDRLRHQRVTPLVELTELPPAYVASSFPPPDEAVNRDQERELLANAIAALPERCREVLTLRKIHGLSQKEIARRLHIGEHSVETHIARGVRLCAEFVRKKGP